ncbi:CxxxxCH/CxxCH domain-containing protein [Planomonospora parontospora]|uniref:CxxxxCH/CxxCH domain-containing protein n=1 Tax=Planomonospora parontospora TaxID=58119 RepID=UPI0035A228A1
MCSGTRCHSGVAASPARVTPASAAWTLAGSMSTNSRARQIPAARRVAGSTSPTAPASSRTPVR